MATLFHKYMARPPHLLQASGVRAPGQSMLLDRNCFQGMLRMRKGRASKDDCTAETIVCRTCGGSGHSKYSRGCPRNREIIQKLQEDTRLEVRQVRPETQRRVSEIVASNRDATIPQQGTVTIFAEFVMQPGRKVLVRQ